jgi:hypothetical protein
MKLLKGSNDTLVRVVLAVLGLVLVFALTKRVLPFGIHLPGSSSGGGTDPHDAILEQPGSTHGH